jgi:hypothetical protein
MDRVLDPVLIQEVQHLLLSTIEEVPVRAADLAARDELSILEY